MPEPIMLPIGVPELMPVPNLAPWLCTLVIAGFAMEAIPIPVPIFIPPVEAWVAHEFPLLGVVDWGGGRLKEDVPPALAPGGGGNENEDVDDEDGCCCNIIGR